tara:strand:+ start:2938 stop:3636 length:699 start_codon:yes stop_codon:yes gene_type:complete
MEIFERTICIGGKPTPLWVRRKKNARRVILRVSEKNNGLIVTLPPLGTLDDVLDIVAKQEKWVQSRLAQVSVSIPFEAGAEIPIFGVPHEICHFPNDYGGVWLTSGKLCVTGRTEHVARRIHDWFRREAKVQIRPVAEAKARILRSNIGRVTIKDTRTRWGSCSAKGNLNFSWRIVLMPRKVFEYIIIHEVAHLREQNHGKEFWKLVQLMDPNFDHSRLWLQKYGEKLYRIG